MAAQGVAAMARERKPFFPTLDTPAKVASWLRGSDAGRAVLDEMKVSYREWLFTTEDGKAAQAEVLERHEQQPGGDVPAVVIFVDTAGNIEVKGERDRVRATIVLESDSATWDGSRDRAVESLGLRYRHAATEGKILASATLPTGSRMPGAQLVPLRELDTLYQRMRQLAKLEAAEATAQDVQAAQEDWERL